MMDTFSKSDIKNMFLRRKGKRYLMLYLYYKDDYFTECPLPVDLIAEKISKDLGLEIKTRSIYYIKNHYKNKEIDSKEKSNSGSGKQLEKKEEKEWTFSEPDPPGSHIREAFAPHIKKKKS